MLDYYKNEGRPVGNTDEALDVMRKWYNNYCFSESCCEMKTYNSDMALYFVNHLVSYGNIPKVLVDLNVKTDYGKLRHLIILDRKLNGNFWYT